jgi:hypothetical protein
MDGKLRLAASHGFGWPGGNADGHNWQYLHCSCCNNANHHSSCLHALVARFATQHKDMQNDKSTSSVVGFMFVAISNKLIAAVTTIKIALDASIRCQHVHIHSSKLLV